MKPLNFIAGKAQAVIAVALLFGTGLSGCGSSNSYNGDNGGDGGGGTQAPLIDAFFTTVAGFVKAASDTTEGESIDALVTTAPENTEPEPLG